MKVLPALLLILRIFPSRAAASCEICTNGNGTCRFISGLYTKPFLVLGYNYVTNIPRSACNILLVQLKPSNNLIALRYENGTYAYNGNGVYWNKIQNNERDKFSFTAGGAIFSANRSSNGATIVESSGPLLKNMDLLLLYREINVGVKYEYTLAAEAFNKFAFPPAKIGYLNYMNQAPAFLTARSNEFRDKKENGYKIKSVRKTAGKRRPKWKLTGYGNCSKECGGGKKKGVYSCMHKGKFISDERCYGLEKKDVTVDCNTQLCKPEYKWVVGGWYKCSTNCGEGVEKRRISCQQKISETSAIVILEEKFCAASPLPENLLRTRPCFADLCENFTNIAPHWRIGNWSSCSSKCGLGLKRREVRCFPDGKDEFCSRHERPPNETECDKGSCISSKTPEWFATEWPKKCSESCGTGLQMRRIYCSADSNGECDENTRPNATKLCTNYEKCRGRWYTGPWSICSAQCNWGKQMRKIVCISVKNNNTDGGAYVTRDIKCDENEKPEEEQNCFIRPCSSSWFVSEWSPCSKTCDNGVEKRRVKCLNETLHVADDCENREKPLNVRSCILRTCSGNPVALKRNTFINDGGNKVPHFLMEKIGVNCTDNHYNCRFVVQARLCNLMYYNKDCCASCTKNSLNKGR